MQSVIGQNIAMWHIAVFQYSNSIFLDKRRVFAAGLTTSVFHYSAVETVAAKQQ